MTKVPKKIPFMKFSGAGNDFIVVDNRKRVVDPGKMSAFVASVCTQHLSVGADGLIFIEKAPKAHFRWRFYNNDGGEADFCGNGARCVARFAYLKGIAPKQMRFEGAAGAGEDVVEDETLACGSGAIASALVAAVVHKVESPVTVVPLSRRSMTVSFRKDGNRFTEVSLTGEARAVYEGEMYPDAWEYKLR